MDIYDLRRFTHVYNYNNHSEGCSIDYIVMNTVNHLYISSGKLYDELIKMSIVEDVEEFQDYRISQWDALNLAIRYELEKEVDKELDNSDIGKAIKNLNNR